MKTNPWKLLLGTALMVVGCGGGIQSDVDDAIETAETGSSQSALMDTAAPSGSMAAMADSSAVADAASLKMRGAMSPSGCLTITRNGNTVTYVMVNCKGPWGRVTFNGTVVVVYTKNADGSISAVATSQGLKANEATIDLNATGVYSKDAAGVEHVALDTDAFGTGPRGITADHNSHLDITRDQATQCRTLDGNASTDWSGARGGTATTSTTITGIKKCGDACPAAGGQVVHHGFFGRVITVDFDGSAVAKWSSTGGRSGTVNMKCGQ